MHRSPGWLTAAFDRTVRPLLWDPRAIVRPFVEPGNRVADIGCGPGFYASALSSLIGSQGELFLIEVQEDLLERAVRRVGRNPRAEADLTPILAADERLDLPREIDFALMSWMLHEVRRPELLWESLHRHLRPAAKALVIEPKLHVGLRRFEEQLAPARDLGFRISEVHDIFFCRACVATRGSGARR